MFVDWLCLVKSKFSVDGFLYLRDPEFPGHHSELFLCDREAIKPWFTLDLDRDKHDDDDGYRDRGIDGLRFDCAMRLLADQQLSLVDGVDNKAELLAYIFTPL